ncbi:MAG TPA: DUF4912 domain-containing protein [Fibrobacteria bacterium]|nr:DUF4912 domain-containing protein [Fibrobacteria bacterium]
MSSRLDKNSKLSTGKSKESSSAGKPKTKAASEAKASKPTKTTASKVAPVARVKADSAKEIAAKKAAPEKEAKVEKVSSKVPVATKSTAATKPPRRAPAAILSKSATVPSEGLTFEEFSIALIKGGETKERIWRTKTFHQVPVQREFGFPDVAPELPGQYHQDKLVLMPKDPEYMFCYWELTPTLIDDKSREKIPEGNYRETLKINWESRSLFEPNFTFIPVFFWARKWYFGVPQVGQRYQVELGWLSDTGHFISIIRSNLSELPESWAQTQKRLSEAGDVLAFSSRHSKMLGASEHIALEDSRAFVPEWNLSSESFSSSSWSRGPSADTAATTKTVSASTPTKPAAKKSATPKAHLEVSGKVLPGIKVSVDDKGVSTDGLGYFKIEFPYDQDTLKLELTDTAGASRSFAYDLKELVLT